MADLDTDISDLRALGIDLKAVDEKQADLRAVDRQLVEAQRKLAGARPGDKDYQATVAAHSSLINALETTLAGCRDDLKAAVEAAKVAALEGASVLDDYRTKIFECRRAAAVHLIAAHNFAVQEHTLISEASAQFEALARWAAERRQETSYPPYLRAAGGAGVPTSALEMVKAYFSRFLGMIPSGQPAAGTELAWFDRRRW